MADRETYLDPDEASKFLGNLGLPIAWSTLAKMRCVGGGARLSTLRTMAAIQGEQAARVRPRAALG